MPRPSPRSTTRATAARANGAQSTDVSRLAVPTRRPSRPPGGPGTARVAGRGGGGGAPSVITAGVYGTRRRVPPEPIRAELPGLRGPRAVLAIDLRPVIRGPWRGP